MYILQTFVIILSKQCAGLLLGQSARWHLRLSGLNSLFTKLPCLISLIPNASLFCIY